MSSTVFITIHPRALACLIDGTTRRNLDILTRDESGFAIVLYSRNGAECKMISVQPRQVAWT